MTRMLALSEPRLGRNPFNHARSVNWFLFDEHGEGFYVSWVEYVTGKRGPECMAFRARRGKDGDVQVASWSEEAVSYEPDASIALVDVIMQLEKQCGVYVCEGDPAEELRPGEMVSDAQ